MRAAVRDVVADGGRALVLGGCCALVPGALAGLRDAVGALGVAYVDGHVDVYDGATSPTGEGADMPMSVAFGRGPEAWVDAAGGASVAPADVVVLGARDPEEAADIADLRAGDARGPRGPRPRRAARGRACAPRARAPRSGWAPTAGPSGSISTSTCSTSAPCRRPTTSCPTASSGTSSPQLLRPSGASPALAGLSLGCLNPEKDPGGAYTERTCALLGRRAGRALSQTSRRVSSRSRSRSRRRMISSLILPTLRRRMISARSASSTLRRRRW